MGIDKQASCLWLYPILIECIKPTRLTIGSRDVGSAAALAMMYSESNQAAAAQGPQFSANADTG
jgi:hypothetical protein